MIGVTNQARMAGMNKPNDNGGCLTILIIIGLIVLFKMCIGGD